MSKLVLFLIIPLVVCALPDGRELKELKKQFEEILASDNSVQCQREYFKYKRCSKKLNEMENEAVESSEESVFEIPTKEDVSNAIDIINGTAECIGEVSCNKFRLVQYGNHASAYILENLVYKPYDCLSKSTLAFAAMKCAMSEIPQEVLQSASTTNDLSALLAYIKPVFKCMAQGLEGCSIEQKNAFYRGGWAFADVYEVLVEVQGALAEKTLPAFANSFNEEFYGFLYDKLQL